MAAYCVIDDLLAWVDEDNLVGLASKGDEATIADAVVISVINKVIETAGAEIDSYLLGRYGSTLRTGTVPTAVKQACSRLAVYFLYLRRRVVDDDWQANFEEITRWLRDLRDGKGELLASETTGAAVDTQENEYQSDGGYSSDDDLRTNDQRQYTFSKQTKLFGIE